MRNLIAFLHTCVLVLVLLLLSACQNQLIDNQPTSKNNLDISHYQKAEQFLPKNISQLTDNLKVTPHWIGETNRFWFTEENPQQGLTFYLVTPDTQSIEALFDHESMAKALSSESDSLNAGQLSIDNFSIDEPLSQAKFTFRQQQYECDLTLYQCTQAKDNTKPQSNQNLSPDKQWLAEVIEWDLYLTNTTTNKKTRITFDGSEEYPYAVNNMNPQRQFNRQPNVITEELSLFWSPDGQSLITHRLDRRNVGKLHLIQSVTGEGLRPRLYSYYYPLAGDENIPRGDIIEVKLSNLSAKKLQVPQSLLTYYGGPIWGWWEAGNNRFYFLDRARANKSYTLYEYDPVKLNARIVIQEKNDKYIDPWVQQIKVLPALDQIIWSSERSGTQQLYRYQLSTGKLLNRVTQCDCFVRSIVAIDEINNQLYFEASGDETIARQQITTGSSITADPYYRYLYQVNLSGENQLLLTPEIANHDVTLSPKFDYFLDTYSSPVQVPINQLRASKTGAVVIPLGHPDVSRLDAAGWNVPEPFNLLANDGKTRLFGLIYKPSDFDATQNYPIIDATYTGPHGFFTPKSYWSYYGQESALAELGFIVIKMDGRGTGKRDRAFHEISYQNLAGGVDDHVYAIKKLAEQRQYMDIDRVGIYGFSAGGYDTVQAMFRHADFFKVGVAASGNHDFRIDKTDWNETWLSHPVSSVYDQQSNLNPELIKQLKGKLLLAHGELDENVNPAATLQLVNGLINANKDFDLLIFPNQHHNLNKSDYFVRKRWDYFVEHLLNKTPPKEFLFELNNTEEALNE